MKIFKYIKDAWNEVHDLDSLVMFVAAIYIAVGIPVLVGSLLLSLIFSSK